MEVTGLMIGDWVSVTGTPMRIGALGTIKAGFLDGKGEMFFHNYDILEPIPLTHEILVKNGLEESFDGAIEYRIAKLEYVHQLQHAIRLLGIDKEIIL